MALQQFRKRITTSTTTTIVPQSCSIHQFLLVITNAGTGWSFKIVDQASPAFTFVAVTTLAAQNLADRRIETFEDPIHMKGGVNIVTASGTPGEVCVWITAQVN